MRILFVLPYLPSLIRVRSYNFVRELARRHDVSILATDAPTALAEAEDLRRWCQRVEVVPFRAARAVQSCGRAAVQGDPLQAAVCWSPAWERRLQNLLAQESYDVVHIEHLRAARLRRAVPEHIPTVFDAVDCISLLLERTLRSSHSVMQRAIAALELHRIRAYEAKLLGQFDRVVVTSDVDAQALQALGPSAPVAVVPNCVDVEYFSPLPGPRERETLVLAGKMSYHANVTAALHLVRDILPLVRNSAPGVRVRIVGKSPPASVQSLARDPAIEVTGYMADIRQAVGRSSIAVCPIKVKAGTQYKILEAMAMGLPVVSTREGAEGLWATPGQDLLVADSPQEFADHVCQLLASPALRAQIGGAGRAYVETHHRWDAAARRLEGIYAEAMVGRARLVRTSSGPVVPTPEG